MNKKTHIVVVGNGMVGHRLIEQLCAAPNASELSISVFCAEPRRAYDRVQLSSYFSGTTAEELALTAAGDYEALGVTCYENETVVSVDTQHKLIRSDSGREMAYDKLVMATGSTPFVPPIPGADNEDCMVYRTIEDLEQIAAAGQRSKTGVVIGGGLLGLEAAKALRDMGLETHVVEFAPRLMAVQLDEGGGLLLKSMIEGLGVGVHLGKSTQKIEAGENCRHRLVFADGGTLETDMVLISAGIRPCDALARDTGLELGPRGGIVVNNRCQTSDADIYAIGECALWNGQIFGLVAPGYEMARVVAGELSDDPADEFSGADMSTKLKLMGVDVASIGDALARTAGARTCIYMDETAPLYKKLVISADGKQLLGAVLVGDAEDYGNLLQMMLNGIPLPERPESLILPSMDGVAKPALGVAALPESAQICSCNNVSKGALCGAVQQGCTTLGSLKDQTRAGTSCGGCVALVKDVLNAELSAQGIEVNNHLCEHFELSRQEMEHVVRVNKIRDFGRLLAEHGKGHGCDICKPTAASIFASTWNEHVLRPHLAPLQDTNDAFMANLQKDGTYSVVPRIPGGEITPDKLIVIGEVAKEFDLYTKITGGQRIDLFGARLEQLPPIWKRLVDAGFESGHAYGKSLRTVKSCVGSNWCRYGVQDSVGMAIRLEERYRGVRAPHKIKFAVSGCTRECAEAQSKDVGVIATENGWNLYVAGNGGMKPRHADLFATDLDDETLIRLIDRFLMLYVRTGDRLQRTARWLENLEGGLDYVKQVVLDDSLGLAAELEQQMQSLIDSYACEWKKTLEDSEQLQRFRQFVNTDASDERIEFVRERGQIRPARAEERRQKEEMV